MSHSNQFHADQSKENYFSFLTESLSKHKPAKPNFKISDLVTACPELDLRLQRPETMGHHSFTSSIVTELGLALAGYSGNLSTGCVLLVGPAEQAYLEKTPKSRSKKTWQAVLENKPGCLILTDASSPNETLREIAAQYNLPLFESSKDLVSVARDVRMALQEAFAPSLSFHGDLVVFCGMGILILGKSGIGKSDCALDLITHGHQLVADDIVHVRRNPLGDIIGKGKDFVRHHMDIRGLGIVNIKELFSVYSVVEEYTVDLIIFLEPWDHDKNYACFQEQQTIDLLGVPKPLLRLPVGSGRNWENLIQVAVRNFILKSKGYDAEKAIAEKVKQAIKEHK